MEEYLWKVFESTGSIEAYLTYKSYKNNNNRLRSKEEIKNIIVLDKMLSNH